MHTTKVAQIVSSPSNRLSIRTTLCARASANIKQGVVGGPGRGQIEPVLSTFGGHRLLVFIYLVLLRLLPRLLTSPQLCVCYSHRVTSKSRSCLDKIVFPSHNFGSFKSLEYDDVHILINFVRCTYFLPAIWRLNLYRLLLLILQYLTSNMFMTLD